MLYAGGRGGGPVLLPWPLRHSTDLPVPTLKPKARESSSWQFLELPAYCCFSHSPVVPNCCPLTRYLQLSQYWLAPFRWEAEVNWGKLQGIETKGGQERPRSQRSWGWSKAPSGGLLAPRVSLHQAPRGSLRQMRRSTFIWYEGPAPTVISSVASKRVDFFFILQTFVFLSV